MTLFSLIAFSPFTSEDAPGTPLQKMCWQFEIWIAGKAMQMRWYGIAEAALTNALNAVNNYTAADGKHVKNYDNEILTLTKQAEVYLYSGNSAKQDETIEKVVQLDKERYEKRAEKLLDEMKKSRLHIEALIKSGDSLERHVAEPELNWAGQVRHIVEISRRLDANYAYSKEYDLLTSAASLMKRLYGADFVGLADIYEQLADCLLSQDRVDEVGNMDLDGKLDQFKEMDLYQEIRRLRFIHAQNGTGNPEQDVNYIRAELHLGQWQRDRGQLPEAQITLLKAARMAEKCKKIKRDELTEYYGSLADLYEQTKNMEEAKIQRAKVANVCSTGNSPTRK